MAKLRGIVTAMAAATSLVGVARAEDPQAVSEVVVTGQRTVAAGQVSTDAQVGVLGNRNVFDTPFSTSAYTGQLVLDQQARSLADVLDNDAAVRTASSRYAESENLTIRGFQVAAGNTLFAGLPGLVDERQPALDGVERVEVFKGPSGVINNNSADSNVGGTVNFVPKRAEAQPLTRVTLGFDSDATGEAHLDAGRRFGPADAFGVRVGLGGRYGDTPIDNQRDTSGIATLALDYHTDRLRLSLDANYQNRELLANLSQIGIVEGIDVPDAPDSSLNLFDRSTTYRKRDGIVVVQGEYDLTSRVTVFAAYGHQNTHERYQGAYAPTIVDAQGDVSVSVIPYVRDAETDSARAGLRARFETGPISHVVTLAADGVWNPDHGGYAFDDTLSSNIYRPVRLAPLTPAYPDPPEAYRRTSTRESVALADVASALDGRVTVIAGVREQRIANTNRDEPSGVESSSYDQSKATPAAALLIKPLRRLTLYANYVQQLQSGPTAPFNVSNANQAFPPVVAEQEEVGAKYDFGRAGVTLALYQITEPVGVTSVTAAAPLGVFSVDGEQRNRGLELNAFGEVAKGVRVLGGVSLIDAVQTGTSDLDGDGRGDNDGRRAVGVPHVQLNVGGEWDVARVPGLTLTGRVIYTSDEAVDPDTERRIPDWTRLDLGARYAFKAAGKHMVARLNVQNVAGADYWASALGGALAISAPRTVLLSLSTDF